MAAQHMLAPLLSSVGSNLHRSLEAPDMTLHRPRSPPCDLRRGSELTLAGTEMQNNRVRQYTIGNWQYVYVQNVIIITINAFFVLCLLANYLLSVICNNDTRKQYQSVSPYCSCFCVSRSKFVNCQYLPLAGD